MARRLHKPPMKFTLELSERDLRFFRGALQKARRAVRDADEHDIVDAVESVLAEIRGEAPLPDFVALRIPQIEALIAMLRDEEWNLPAAARERVLAAFAYFGDPEDLLPDNIPVIGYLDDVIVIELVVRELQHVREAYADFCNYRDEVDGSPAGQDALIRRDRIDRRRQKLHQRMKRRQTKDRSNGRWTALW